jgi:hypothetical protein
VGDGGDADYGGNDEYNNKRIGKEGRLRKTDFFKP